MALVANHRLDAEQARSKEAESSTPRVTVRGVQLSFMSRLQSQLQIVLGGLKRLAMARSASTWPQISIQVGPKCWISDCWQFPQSGTLAT
jgi:hypothetical protein